MKDNLYKDLTERSRKTINGDVETGGMYQQKKRQRNRKIISDKDISFISGILTKHNESDKKCVRKSHTRSIRMLIHLRKEVVLK